MPEIQQHRVIHTILHEELVAAYTVSQSVMDGLLHETGTAQTHDMVTEVPSDHLVEDFVDLGLDASDVCGREIRSDARLFTGDHEIKSVSRENFGHTNLIIDHLFFWIVLLEQTEQGHDIRILRSRLRSQLPTNMR